MLRRKFAFRVKLVQMWEICTFQLKEKGISCSNADASEAKTKLLDVIGGINSTGISVTEVPDLFDVWA